MKVKEICQYLENIAPVALQESYDNSGLIVGDENDEIQGILITLDITEKVIDEAIMTGSNLIIAHHPIIFGGLKKITGRSYVERSVIKAIKNGISLYASHTNLDNIPEGVNGKIAEKLGLINNRILSPKAGLLKKLITFCPVAKSDSIREALFNAGAGHIGNYDSCSFNSSGLGTFKAGENTAPFVGVKGEIHKEEETRIEVVFYSHQENNIIQSLLAVHPYEEVAYDIYQLTNKANNIGAGILGELPAVQPADEFLKFVKEIMKTECIRYTGTADKKIRKVAVCGGSGSFLLEDAIKQGADIFITADYKYHQFFDADHRIIIADIGHYESEQFTKELFYEFLNKKKCTFAIRLSEINTNPINYI